VFQVTILVFFLTSRQHAVRHPLPERILWIGAHPDDEAYVAPLLGRSCVEGNDRCSLLVMTRGEGGGDPVVRSAEMRRAADLLNAHLDLWTLSDVGIDVDGTWSAESGGHEALIEHIESAIDAERPSIIYTFDPNHGSTCHPAHRAVGALVIEAVARLESTLPRVLLVETTVDFLPNDFVFHSAAPDAIAIDATQAWRYLVDDISTHASQFTSEQIEALRHTPAEQRRVFLATVPAQKYSCDR
jgi:LmbE family N-acetylglucosaminyl deacetylase